MKQSEFPLGWDEKRVKETLTHYESQTEEEAVAEDEAAFLERVSLRSQVREASLKVREDALRCTPGFDAADADGL